MARKRLLLIASAGGHWIELCRLSRAFEGMEALYVTTFTGAIPPSGSRPVTVVRDASRSTPVRGILLLAQLMLVVLRFRPHVVITTGAAPGLIAVRLARLFGARTVWIDSMANSEELSLSGKLAGDHVDLWLTQWPDLTDKYPGLRYYGSVL